MICIYFDSSYDVLPLQQGSRICFQWCRFSCILGRDSEPARVSRPTRRLKADGRVGFQSLIRSSTILSCYFTFRLSRLRGGIEVPALS